MMYLFTFIVIWLLCGFVGAGFMCKYYLTRFEILYTSKKERFWEEWESFWLSMVFGPIGLIVTVFSGYIRHGWKIPFIDKENKQ